MLCKIAQSGMRVFSQEILLRRAWMIRSSSVVPAKAGTHSHRGQLGAEAVNQRAKTHGRGVWVPAFAGTTDLKRRVARPRAPARSAGLDRQNHHFLLLFGLWPAGVLPEANGLTGAAPPFFRFLSAFGFFFSLLLRI